MPSRRVNITIDITQDPSGPAKVKGAFKSIETEAKRINKETAANAKQSAKVIEGATKARVDEEIRQEKRLERERKRIANEFLASVQKLKSQSSGVGLGTIAGGSFLGNVGANAFSQITSQATSAASAVFNFSSKLQQTQISFSALMKNSQLAAQHIKELKDLTTEFPLEFTSIAKMSQRLQGAGFEAQKIIPLIKDIGNIAAATGDLGAERMEGLATALSQIASKGRVSAEEMEQLSERSVPAWRILSEAIGKTSAETRKMAEDGEISSQQLFDAFQKFSRMNFGDAMKKQAGTFSGSMQQIRNILLQTAATAFEPFFKEISNFSARAAKEIKQQEPGFRGIGQLTARYIVEGMVYALPQLLQQFPQFFVKELVNSFRGQTPIWAMFTKALMETGSQAAWGVPHPGMPSPYAGTPNVNLAVQNAVPTRIPGMNYGTSPGTFAGGGVPTPKTKSSKVNLKLKGDFDDAFRIVSKYGLIITSGADGKHNARSAHYTGQAFDVRTNGVPDAVVRAAMDDLAQAGYYIKDERSHPTGQKVWSAPHFHVGSKVGGGLGTQMAALRAGSGEVISGIMREQSEVATKAQRDKIVDQALYLFRLTGMMPSPELIDEFLRRMNEYAQSRGLVQTSRANLLNQINAISAGRAGPLTTTPGDVSVGLTNRVFGDRYSKDDDEAAAAERVFNAFEKLEEATKAVTDAQLDAIKQLQIEKYRQTREAVEETIDLLSQGDIKGVFRAYAERQRRAFVTKATDWVMEKLGIENPEDTPELKEARRQTKLLEIIAGVPAGSSAIPGVGSLIPSIFGGGGMGQGPGGTPLFNPMGKMGMGTTMQQGGGWLGSIGQLLGIGGGSSGSMVGQSGTNGISPAGGGLGGLFGGMFSPVKNPFTGKMNSSAAGTMGGIGAIMGMVGGMIPGRLGGVLSMAGTGMSIGSMFGPWGAAIGAGVGALVGLFTGKRDNAEKKLKEAAASQFGINVKDKNVLKQLKALGESMFGKGNVGANAATIVSSDQGQNILRAYAEASGQSSAQIDNLYKHDPDWKGNQFRGKFGGFRAMGGPVKAGYSYVVGERGPERFTASQNGSITPGGGMDPRTMQVLGSLEEVMHQILTRMAIVNPGDFVGLGAQQNPDAISKAVNTSLSTSLRGGENQLRAVGAY